MKTLVSGNLTAGEHTEVWDGTDDAGRRSVPACTGASSRPVLKTNKKMVILK
ncbi:MAG: hypothetical protein IPK72_10900 [Candidatus Eisenbacteria bacterium]|nr:hypothetical protein [Candidatus Eisenbacteria bacterium]